MSSDSQLSFRANWKNKFKNVIKSNVTSSIREQFIRNDTYQHLRGKYHNFTDKVKDETGLGKIINKTKELISNELPYFKGNRTQSKGFFDSLFTPETPEDVYVETAVVSLWVIAILCIIPTIIMMFIRSKRLETTASGVKMIYFHVFLCELFYLTYILLAMINVAQNFQLQGIFCSIANYGMYITIPVMHLTLLLLSIERVVNKFGQSMRLAQIFTKSYAIQVILSVIWIGIVAVTATMILVKEQLLKSFQSNIQIMTPSVVQGVLGRITSNQRRCSIDGRLSSVFKVFLIILFVILIILIIKSLAISVFYTYYTSNCCSKRKKSKDDRSGHMTLIFLIFIFLNIAFSFPFYAVSMKSTFQALIEKKPVYTMQLKMCFMLRIVSIILQCLTFSTFETSSWNILSRLLYYMTCKRFSALKDIISSTPSSSTRNLADQSNEATRTEVAEKVPTTREPEDAEGLTNVIIDESDDDVFLRISDSETSNRRKPQTTNTRIGNTLDNRNKKAQKSERPAKESRKHHPDITMQTAAAAEHKLKSEKPKDASSKSDSTQRAPEKTQLIETRHRQRKLNAATETRNVKHTQNHASFHKELPSDSNCSVDETEKERLFYPLEDEKSRDQKILESAIPVTELRHSHKEKQNKQKRKYSRRRNYDFKHKQESYADKMLQQSADV